MTTPSVAEDPDGYTTLRCEMCGHESSVIVEDAQGQTMTGAEYVELNHIAGLRVVCEECAR
ncbi:MAG: hypothetical protein ACR2FE_08750 [Aeromicrobium sp.]